VWNRLCSPRFAASREVNLRVTVQGVGGVFFFVEVPGKKRSIGCMRLTPFTGSKGQELGERVK
jgi:hypothetical protein